MERAVLPTPIDLHGRQVTEATSKVTWTANAGAEIKPGEFQEFEVSLGPLPEVDQIIFKALQTYSSGEIVRWIDEPAEGTEPEHPAPVLKLSKPNGASGSAPTAGPVAPAAQAASTQSSISMLVAILALIIGLAGLAAGVLAFRAVQQRP